MPVAQAPSAVAAFRRIIGPSGIRVEAFPEPDIRRRLRGGRHRVWRYDGMTAVPAVAPPSAEAVRMLHVLGGEPWASPLSGLFKAEPFGALPLDDLLGLLAHPPDGPRWNFIDRETPSYWYRFLQPWVCLGILQPRP
jgi:hypothetical protein